MIAALPMYDRPECRTSTDRLWNAIRNGLRAHGIDAPDGLTRDCDPWDIWTSPDLVFAQTCGLPFRTKLHDRVRLVAAPDFGLPGCAAGYYYSVIVARGDGPSDGPRLAINDPLSQSGWAALHEYCTQAGIPPDVALVTGGHRASARAVLDDLADLAAIDAQTWRMIQRYDRWSDDLTEVTRTEPTPALPYITGPDIDADAVHAALSEAVRALGQQDRAALDLHGIRAFTAQDYLRIAIPPAPSART